MTIPKRILFLLLVIISMTGVVVFHFTNWSEYLSIEYLKEQQSAVIELYDKDPYFVIEMYVVLYIVVASLYLPGFAFLNLASGAIFGLFQGIFISFFASAMGATIAFLFSHFIFYDFLQERFHEKMKICNRILRRDGQFYLFAFRLIPMVPFYLVNLIMGVTPIKTHTFFLIGGIGMLPGIMVYVNAGSQLYKIKSFDGIMGINIFIALTILGLLPVCTRLFVRFLHKTIPHHNPNLRHPKHH